MLLRKDYSCIIFVLVLTALTTATRTKRMYAMCPPHFKRIGSECYFLSSDRVNWLDAHFECKDRNSRLAEPFKFEDRELRKYLIRSDQLRKDIWIGGIFNWERNKWQWGYNGRNMKYQSFSQMTPGSSQDLKFHCAVLNPQLKYRWSARSCVDRHHYICQHRMPYVNEQNRLKVYNKWNETYPNEMANEIEEVLPEGDHQRYNRRQFTRRNNRKRILTERNHQTNSIQPQVDNRLENRVDATLNQRQIDNNNLLRRRKNHHNRQRQAKDRAHRNEVLNSVFEPKINRTRSHPRNPIRFDGSDVVVQRRRNHHNNPEKRKKHKHLTTTSTPITTTSSTTSTTPIPPTNIILSTTESFEQRQQAQYEQSLIDDKMKIEQEEIRRYEEKLRRKQDEEELRMKEEERRIYEENEKRAKHFKEMELRRQQQEKEQRQKEKDDQIRAEKQHQEEQRKIQNEINRQQYEEQQRKQQELLRQQEEEALENERKQTVSVQSNDVIEPEHHTIDTTTIPTTTTTTTSKATTTEASNKRQHDEDKKSRRDQLRARLQKLSPQEQRLFFERRRERNKKRGIANSDHTVTAQ